MVKSDGWIIRTARRAGLIEPFEPRQVKSVETPAGPSPVISFGVSSYGYDIRAADTFKILDPRSPNNAGAVVDPKNFNDSHFTPYQGPVCVIPAHGMAIAQSLEYFRIPREILAICTGKSTYSRCGVLVSISPLEPEWEGRLTFAIANTNSVPAKVYAGEGIAQIIFLEADEMCDVSYADKKGKYQKQSTLTTPKV